MGNLDWGSKFSLDMSHNRGEGKKFDPVEINKFYFWPISPLFDGIDQKLRKCKKNAFLKATTFIKHKNHNLDF